MPHLSGVYKFGVMMEMNLIPMRKVMRLSPNVIRFITLQAIFQDGVSIYTMEAQEGTVLTVLLDIYEKEYLLNVLLHIYEK
jgi:hypothetical protein